MQVGHGAHDALVSVLHVNQIVGPASLVGLLVLGYSLLEEGVVPDG